jgi:phenylalanyl-tRNA synthetase alpha chain
VAYTVPKLTDYSLAALLRAAAGFRLALAIESFELQQETIDPSLSSQERQGAVKGFRDRWLGRKSGMFTQANEIWLKSAPPDWKKQVGQLVNRMKQSDLPQIERLLEHQDFFARQSSEAIRATNRIFDDPKGRQLQKQGLDRYERDKSLFQNLENFGIEDLQTILTQEFHMNAVEILEIAAQADDNAAERVDISLPGVRRPIGAEHPVMRTWREIVAVFQKLGYSVAEGPVVETDYYNFEALNFPPNHPARDTQDTLFIAGQQSKPQRERLLLRTHTSPVQIRTMEKMRPPIRIVIPGTVHRNDPPDASHSPMFHQIEGLAVDTNITFGDLKGTLDHAMKALFGSSVKTHFRPSFFPFTEPSAELYVTCFICGGSGKRGSDPCRPCKQTGWIEVLGCGMVDPNVFEFVKDNGYDPKKVSGFAFGMGVDRLALLKYGVDDLQYFFQGDVRFLQQFS